MVNKASKFLLAITVGSLLLSSCSSQVNASELVNQGCQAWQADHTDAELAEMNGWEDLESALTYWSEAARIDGSFSDLSTAGMQSLTWLKMDSDAQMVEVSNNSSVFQNVQSAVQIMQGYCGPVG